MSGCVVSVYILKNSSSYKLTGEKSLEVDEVYAKKNKVNFCKPTEFCLIVYRH